MEQGKNMTLKQGVARTRNTRDIYRVANKRMKYGHLGVEQEQVGLWTPGR